MQEYNDRKQEVRWEIAWDIFDAINERQGLNTQFEIDLNELDVEEAQAISKQKIYDIAENAKKEQIEMNLPRSRDFVLAILCADNHFDSRGGNGKFGRDGGDQTIGTPFTQISEDMSENNAFPMQKNENSSQFLKQQSGMTPQQGRYTVNLILHMIQQELKLDHHYIGDLQTVLVRINGQTSDNSVLADW